MENIGKVSVSHILDSAPAGSLGVALMPNGGSYSMVATTGGDGAGGGAAVQDTGWTKVETQVGNWRWRAIGKQLYITIDNGEWSTIGAGAAGRKQLFTLPPQFASKVNRTMVPIVRNDNTVDGTFIDVRRDGTIWFDVKGNNQTYIPPVITTLID